MLGHDVAVSRSFLDLLYDEAARSHFDELLASATAAATDEEERARLRADYDVALRLRELISRQRSREAELSALYETASDLTAIRDVDAILAAIVRRARQLLNADMTYLSLNDELDGASYMKVTDGALTPEFRRLRLPLGTGLLGLVAQTGAPYFTEDYQADARFVHRTYIDEAVDGERIRAILGVPLVARGRVIGALLAVHRTVRKFPPAEVSLLTSFAAHASVALENARLFAELDTANRNLTEHTSAVESAATAHDRLTDLLLHGGGTDEIALALGDLLRGRVAVLDPSGERVAGDADLDTWREAVAESVASGHCVPTPRGYVAAAAGGQRARLTVVIEGAAAVQRGAAHAGARRAGDRAGGAARADGRRGGGAHRRRAAARPPLPHAVRRGAGARARPPARRPARRSARRRRGRPRRGRPAGDRPGGGPARRHPARRGRRARGRRGPRRAGGGRPRRRRAAGRRGDPRRGGGHRRGGGSGARPPRSPRPTARPAGASRRC